MVKKITLLSLLASIILVMSSSISVKADTSYDTTDGVGFTGKWTPPESSTPTPQTPQSTLPVTDGKNGTNGAPGANGVNGTPGANGSVQSLPKTGDTNSSLSITFFGLLLVAFSSLVLKNSVTHHFYYKRRTL